MRGSNTTGPSLAVSWRSCDGKEIRRTQNGDLLKRSQRQQVPTVSCDDMCCPDRRYAFQDLVVGWVSRNGLERTPVMGTIRSNVSRSRVSPLADGER
jgi:hypothetical protein